MPTGVYKRKLGTGKGVFGKYTRTLDIRKKMSKSHKENPTRYWLGKKIPKEIVERIKETKLKNGKEGNKNYFKVHVFKGEEHRLWKGDKVSYIPLNQWLYRELGQPEICEYCGKTGLKGKQIHWANKSKKYKRDLEDWLRLCAKCHYHYDRD